MMIEVPRGLEILVKKAAVDAAFRECLLRERDRAAARIGLVLDPAEAALLRAIPAAQIEAVVANTTVPPRFRAAFMGYAAAAMLAAAVPLTACKSGNHDDNSAKKSSNNPNGTAASTVETNGDGQKTIETTTLFGKDGKAVPEPRGLGGTRPDMPVKHNRGKYAIYLSEVIGVTCTENDRPGKMHAKIRNKVWDYRTIFLKLYVKHAKMHPDIHGGTIGVRFTIKPSGDVENVEIKEDTIGIPELGNEILQVIETWHYVLTPDNDVIVDCPLVFYTEDNR